MPVKARMRPSNEKLESYYAVKRESENYDDNAADHLKTEYLTLNSVKVPPKTHYCIGVLRGGDLHLTPIKSVLQMRPSTAHIDANDDEINQANAAILKDEKALEEREEEEKEEEEATEVTVTFKKRETSWATKMRESSYAYLVEQEESEPWVDLKVFGDDSAEAEASFNKLLVPESEYFKSITEGGAVLATNSSVYLTDMCKVSRLVNGERRTDTKLSKKDFHKLSGQVQVAELLKAGKVLPFHQIYELATNCGGVEACLKYCVAAGRLVQGLWVCKSEVLTTSPYHRDCRDYILLQFWRYGHVTRSKLHGKIGLSMKEEVDMLKEYGEQNQKERKWFLKCPTDTLFQHNYSDLKATQDEYWSKLQEDIEESLHTHIASASSYSSALQSISSQIGGASDKTPSSPRAGASQETIQIQAQFEPIINDLLTNDASNGVYSFKTIEKTLSDINATKIRNKETPLYSGVTFPTKSLRGALSKVAIKIENRELYVRKSYGDDELDQCRMPILKLLSLSSNVKKKEVEKAVAEGVQRTLRPVVFKRLMGDLATPAGTSWILKVGN